MILVVDDYQGEPCPQDAGGSGYGYSRADQLPSACLEESYSLLVVRYGLELFVDDGKVAASIPDA